jgi:hypothetical protein
MDYTGAHRLKVAPGDELRVFTRIQAGRQVIANNSDVIVSMILVDEAVVRRGLVAKAVLTDEQPRLTRDAIWQAVTESVSTHDIRLNVTTTLRGRADHDTAPRAQHMQRAGQGMQRHVSRSPGIFGQGDCQC